jgi:hypothetical protein
MHRPHASVEKETISRNKNVRKLQGTSSVRHKQTVSLRQWFFFKNNALEIHGIYFYVNYNYKIKHRNSNQRREDKNCYGNKLSQRSLHSCVTNKLQVG